MNEASMIDDPLGGMKRLGWLKGPRWSTLDARDWFGEGGKIAAPARSFVRGVERDGAIQFPLPLAASFEQSPIVATVTIASHEDGTFSAFHPLPDGASMALANGDLAGAIEFARERPAD